MGFNMSLITLVGVAAAIFTTMAFLPQAIKTIRTKHALDLSLSMLAAQSTGNFIWIIYGFLISDVPVTVANIITLSLVLTILFLKIKYK